MASFNLQLDFEVAGREMRMSSCTGSRQYLLPVVALLMLQLEKGFPKH